MPFIVRCFCGRHGLFARNNSVMVQRWRWHKAACVTTWALSSGVGESQRRPARTERSFIACRVPEAHGKNSSGRHRKRATSILNCSRNYRVGNWRKSMRLSGSCSHVFSQSRKAWLKASTLKEMQDVLGRGVRLEKRDFDKLCREKVSPWPG